MSQATLKITNTANYLTENIKSKIKNSNFLNNYIEKSLLLDSLKCDKCNINFNLSNHSPIFLKCGHTLCKKCILNMKTTKIKCPIDNIINLEIFSLNYKFEFILKNLIPPTVRIYTKPDIRKNNKKGGDFITLPSEMAEDEFILEDKFLEDEKIGDMTETLGTIPIEESAVNMSFKEDINNLFSKNNCNDGVKIKQFSRTTSNFYKTPIKKENNNKKKLEKLKINIEDDDNSTLNQQRCLTNTNTNTNTNNSRIEKNVIYTNKENINNNNLISKKEFLRSTIPSKKIIFTNNYNNGISKSNTNSEKIITIPISTSHKRINSKIIKYNSNSLNINNYVNFADSNKKIIITDGKLGILSNEIVDSFDYNNIKETYKKESSDYSTINNAIQRPSRIIYNNYIVNNKTNKPQKINIKKNNYGRCLKRANSYFTFHNYNHLNKISNKNIDNNKSNDNAEISLKLKTTLQNLLKTKKNIPIASYPNYFQLLQNILQEKSFSPEKLKIKYIEKDINSGLFIGYIDENTDSPRKGGIIFDNEEYYIGELKHGKKEGKGKIIYKNGTKYEGGFKNNKREGMGKLNQIDGETFTGEWKNGKINGKGIRIHNNGDKYIGNYVNNIRNGQGKYVFINGNVYEGNWANGKANGKGIFKFSNGSVYEGEFKDNNLTGKGKFIMDNGEIYIGMFKNSLIEGKGSVINKEGEKYIGNFFKGKKNGEGVLWSKEGKIIQKGIWKNDKYYGGVN